jgi:HTH-type transcriptional regulator / antitoxin HigA
MMESIKPIENEIEYRLALQKLSELMDVKSNTPECHFFEALSIVVHDYEDVHYKIEPLTLEEICQYEVEEGIL